MLSAEIAESSVPGLSPEAILQQLDLLTSDPGFRASKRSVQFLRYVVTQTLQGSSDQIKERAIGVEVFGRDPSYDTNVDHVVRTAAIELRKRLAIYYGQEQHKNELRMSLVPGSYVPRFTLPQPTVPPADPEVVLPDLPPSPPSLAGASQPVESLPEASAVRRIHSGWAIAAAVVGLLCLAAVLGFSWRRSRSAQEQFWKPLLESPGAVLLAVGDVPNGPPTPLTSDQDKADPFPVIHKTTSSTMPFADAVTMARVTGILTAHGKQVSIRREGLSSFSDLRESPVVLIGAFNNQWSLRLTQRMRYSLALDPERHLIYIRDARAPASRTWSWTTNQSRGEQGEAGRPPLQDFALISRIWNSDTGRIVLVVGGLYTYGTQAAGEFLSDPQLMDSLGSQLPLSNPHSNLQIILRTTVTDGTPGPPRVVAISTE